MIKIWERYFIKEIAKIFFLFLFGFYTLFILLDYSNHSASFHKNHIRFDWGSFLLYYTYEFFGRLDVLLPFALLLASIKTLCSLSSNRELMALMASGIHLKDLVRPFIFAGLLGTAIIYVNTELILPKALQELKYIHQSQSWEKQQKKYGHGVKHFLLKDHSPVLYHHFDRDKHSFIDAYWIKNIDEVYKMGVLTFENDHAIGRYVDHFIRDEAQNLVLDDSYEMFSFPEGEFNSTQLRDSMTTAEEMSLMQLKEKFPKNSQAVSEKDSIFLTTFYYKLAIPWLCLLAIIGPVPYCIRFTRTLPVFMIYSCSIFGLVGFYIMINSAVILGERQVLPPFWAIFSPFLVVFGFFSIQFLRSIYSLRGSS